MADFAWNNRPASSESAAIVFNGVNAGCSEGARIAARVRRQTTRPNPSGRSCRPTPERAPPGQRRLDRRNGAGSTARPNPRLTGGATINSNVAPEAITPNGIARRDEVRNNRIPGAPSRRGCHALRRKSFRSQRPAAGHQRRRAQPGIAGGMNEAATLPKPDLEQLGPPCPKRPRSAGDQQPTALPPPVSHSA